MMTLRWRWRARGELPAGDVESVVQRAAAYAEHLQQTFSSYEDMSDLEVYVGSTRPKGHGATEIHLNALLIRWATGRPVVREHAEPLLRRPDEESAWQQVLTPEEAGHRMQAVLGGWAADT